MAVNHTALAIAFGEVGSLAARTEEWLLSDWDTRQLAVGDAVGKKLRNCWGLQGGLLGGESANSCETRISRHPCCWFPFPVHPHSTIGL